MPRKTHADRKTTKTQANRDTLSGAPTESPERFAKALVERGLASPLILDPRRHAMENRPGVLSHGR